MRRIFAITAFAAAIFTSNANAWQVFYNTATGKLVGSYVDASTTTSLNDAGSRPSGPVNASIDAAGVYITTSDTTNSWVQFDFNVDVPNKTRSLIVFRNPQSTRIAPILKEFKEQLSLGRKLTFIENYSYTQPVLITNRWMGWATQISYDINPGDRVYFTFK